jgi:DNA transformation protein and related proteins
MHWFPPLPTFRRMGGEGRVHRAAGPMNNDFIDYLQELFADFGAVTTRAMFGGHALYHDGVMFAVAFEDGLYLKVDSQTRALFEAEGCVPFVYMQTEKPLTMSYWSAPAAALDSPQAMLPWARLAFEAALRKPARRTARKRSG